VAAHKPIPSAAISVSGQSVPIDAPQAPHRPRRASQLNRGTRSNHANRVEQVRHADRPDRTETPRGQRTAKVAMKLPTKGPAAIKNKAPASGIDRVIRRGHAFDPGNGRLV